MASHRLMIANFQSGVQPLSAPHRHYLINVLRLTPPATVEVFDGKGRFATAQLVFDNRGGVGLEIGAIQPQKQTNHQLSIAMAIPKGERADWVVEKLTEIGVYRIVWIECERSIVNLKPNSSKYSRWLRIAEAAAKQCGRTDIPIIEAVREFSEVTLQLADLKFICLPNSQPLFPHLTSLASPQPLNSLCLIGPEGDFSQKEIALALQHEFLKVGLTCDTLRVETAAMVAAGLLLSAIWR